MGFGVGLASKRLREQNSKHLRRFISRKRIMTTPINPHPELQGLDGDTPSDIECDRAGEHRLVRQQTCCALQFPQVTAHPVTQVSSYLLARNKFRPRQWSIPPLNVRRQLISLGRRASDVHGLGTVIAVLVAVGDLERSTQQHGGGNLA